jgi:hypothetical protein
MLCTFVLADHLWSHAIFVALHLEVGVQLAVPISVLLYFDFFQPFLEDGRSNVWEELANVVEAHDFVLLQQAGRIRLRLLLDEVGEVPRLRVVHLPLGLNLPHCVERIERADHDAPLVVRLLNHAAEKVVVCRRHPVVEDRCVVHVVF